jgi:hypothetical protein
MYIIYLYISIYIYIYISIYIYIYIHISMCVCVQSPTGRNTDVAEAVTVEPVYLETILVRLTT